MGMACMLNILSFPDIGDVRLFALSLLEEALQLPQVQRLAQEQLLGLNC